MITLDPATLDKLPDTASADRPLDDRDSRLLRLLKFLNEEDHLIIKMFLQHGMSQRQIGRALRIPSGTMTRRIRAILARLNDPLIHALLSEHCALCADDRQIGVEYFLQKMTLRQLSSRHQLNWHQLRARIEYIRGWFYGQRPAAR
ncbi:MAG TPA: hypothetical protein VH518_06105 [Tepidisphaeraceae bacterium]|jgi:hypothetical protein